MKDYKIVDVCLRCVFLKNDMCNHFSTKGYADDDKISLRESQKYDEVFVMFVNPCEHRQYNI